MANISTEQALQIPQQLRRQGSGQNSAASATHPSSPSEASAERILSDDAVTLNLQTPPTDKRSQLEVNQLKSALGQDMIFVRETLRNKLAEYGAHPGTRLAVEKDMFGNISLNGQADASILERMAGDLNKSKAFREAFGRLSQQQPTLNYVDNVTKLSRAYGVENSLFRTLLSESGEFNGLSDIAHRFQSVKANAQSFAEGADSGTENPFRLSLNA